MNSSVLPPQQKMESREPVFDEKKTEEEQKKFDTEKIKEAAKFKKMVKRDMKAVKERIQNSLGVDVLIILDCTGSMKPFIEEAQ